MQRCPSVMPPASSRASMVPSNNQSKQAMAAELERTEQSITIALQEVDKNFARANKIVGESILPVIERYTQESRNLWSGAEFWKQFLESAANVKLSGYEEDVNNSVQEPTIQNNDNNTIDETSSIFESEVIPVKSEQVAGPRPTTEEELTYEEDDTTTQLEDLTPEVQSTPHGNKQRRASSPTKIPGPTSTTPKLTPRKDPVDLEDTFEEMSLDTPRKSPMANATTPRSILRHQVLDKNWGIQATPLVKKEYLKDDEFSLSPDIQPPKSNLLGDLSKTEEEPSLLETPKRQHQHQYQHQEPAQQRKPFTPISQNKTPNRMDWTDDDDGGDISMNMSPPVTMHFAGPNIVKQPNQQDLIKTPARQAAKTIVDDILHDVGDESESINASITKTQYTDYLLDDDSF